MGRRVALAAGLILAASLAGDVSGRAEVIVPAVPTAAPRTPEPALVEHPRIARVPRGGIVAYVRPGRFVDVRSSPGGRVLARLGSLTQFGSPRTFAASRAGRGWRVITTELPNGRTGWVAGAGALRLARTPIRLDVDLSARLLRVRNGAQLVRTLRIGVGAVGTPTPAGRFAITDKLRGADYAAAYGCCILALSGHQTNLPRGWTGGDRLAIHGGSTGGAVSTGCIHASDDDLRDLMRLVPLGARVDVHA